MPKQGSTKDYHPGKFIVNIIQGRQSVKLYKVLCEHIERNRVSRYQSFVRAIDDRGFGILLLGFDNAHVIDKLLYTKC